MLEQMSISRQNRLWVLGIPALVAVTVAVISLLLPARYEGAVVVAPINNAQTGGKSNLVEMLGAAADGGLQSTPILVSRLARLDGVLLAVAHEPLGAGGMRVIDAITGSKAGATSDVRALASMQKIVSANADNISGLVTIRVTARDSALVRLVMRKLLAYTGQAFENATRAQATALKHAQDRAVDSALLRLRRAEDSYRQFGATNRAQGAYTEAAMQTHRLERELHLAEDVYSQTVTQRETAAARELESIPVLVIVDDLPAQIRVTSRGILLKVLLWSSLALICTLTVNLIVNRRRVAGTVSDVPTLLSRRA